MLQCTGSQRVGHDIVAKQQLSSEVLSDVLWVQEALVCMLSHFSRVRLFVTLWTMARQAPPSMGFSRQEYWSGWPFPSPVIKYEVSEVKSLSRVRLFAIPWTIAYQAPLPMDFPGESTGVGHHFLLL